METRTSIHIAYALEFEDAKDDWDPIAYSNPGESLEHFAKWADDHYFLCGEHRIVQIETTVKTSVVKEYVE